ncbi:MAG: ATP-dependent DNA ligase [Micromonosporaceae bacterium]|nr:ATP-dependent DNA ligase [Micromonosporaceae bacterium]
MWLAEIAATSAAVAATRSRRAKTELLAGCLSKADPGEVVPAVAYLSGELRQRQIGVGWASLRELPPPAQTPILTVAAVDAALERIGAQRGAGSQSERRGLLGALFAAATADEQRYLRGLLTGEVRQGALAGVMADAVARAAEVPAAEVRRAVLLSGDLRAVAAVALTGGSEALRDFRLEVGRPLAPMLAQAAATVDDAIAKVCPAAVDWKLDGVRIQAHRDGDEVAVFTRSLDDITSRVPEVAAAVRAMPVRSAVLDGEAIALAGDGAPMPFQVTSSRIGRRGDPRQLREETPLSSYYFDLLHLDGEDLMDAPAHRRWTALVGAAPPDLVIPRTVVSTVNQAAEWFAGALDAGHEGVVVKSLDAPYEAGRRGGSWLKVKPRHTLDLVVLAAEWGHGRRRGFLSNLHLGARDPETGGHVMLGKTFKGLTDEMLAWQTERLLALETRRDEWTVHVRPELVAEIAFDGVQSSTRYPGGMALRFARVLRHRDDKPAAEADTVDTVRALHTGRLPSA